MITESGIRQPKNILPERACSAIFTDLERELMSKATADSVSGLASDQARRRLKTLGPNEMPDTAVHPLRSALEKFSAPVPWMLEAAILLEL
ncbi:cation-transporting P-type ATPase, partial [Bradyrhizobium sp.]|uniref:cation-transporting P-type ATPase n=1 Tax=Bradyrhizobium sp. TaxID=376 RepID=UPI003D119BD1